MHSSAKYYATGEQGIYEVMSYALLADIDFILRRVSVFGTLRKHFF
jgi:hypothetical protein